MSISLVERAYDMDDLQMLQRAQVFHDGFIDDKAAFEAAFPMFADPFAADFQTAITDADAIPTGESVMLDIKVVTEQLNNSVALGMEKLQKLYTYVEMIWNSKARNDQFGRQSYSKLNRSQSKTKELLELAHEKAEQGTNKPQLIAAGFTQADIDGLLAQSNLINGLNRQQESMIADQKTKSDIRVTAYNGVWEYMQKLNKASKVVFVNSPARLDFYLLYPSSSSSLPKPQNLTVAPDAQNPQEAVLTWDPVPGAMTYKVYYSERALGQPSGTFAQIDEVTGTNMAVVPIVANRSNYWKIKAYGGGLSSAYSNEVQWDS